MKFEYIGTTVEDLKTYNFINVYRCTNCNLRIKSEDVPEDCPQCRKAIDEFHEEEAQAGLI